ncbi:prefoldin subunit 3 [Petromyzon marinus]|uniref:Prefoldin subunit 3 n=1 Tax=Petromyzon marinus TaxID=7757 RepID=A0AAJ7XHC3_PETMA|nr:prefoldin subunit 3 [Petromyzon marinus]
MASETKSHLGIPEAVFMEDVDAYMKSKGSGETTESVLKHLDEQHQKYKYLEMNLLQKKLRLKNQVPDIKQSLDIIRHMQKKMDSTEPLKTHFLLLDNLYARATIAPTDRVCLWLGANVMLEYEVSEARSLLERNLDTATRNMEQLGTDLDFLRDQFTTTEVNMARVYNWDVKRRQAESKQSGGTA